jgi:hypothetical protein
MSASNCFWGKFLPLGQQKKLENFAFLGVNLTKNELSFFLEKLPNFQNHKTGKNKIKKHW